MNLPTLHFVLVENPGCDLADEITPTHLVQVRFGQHVLASLPACPGYRAADEDVIAEVIGPYVTRLFAEEVTRE